MTSAPVKDVGALMNYVGRVPQTSGIGAESASGFGDVMSKASGEKQNLDNSERIGNAKETVKETRVDKSHTRPEAKKAENGKEVQTDKTSEEAQKAVEEAGREMVKEVAKELGVSEEEVVKAMEVLGLGMADLLDAGNLTQLVLAISGGDSLSLLTDAGLYDSLQSLLTQQKELLTGLQTEFSLSQEELAQLTEGMKNASKEPESLTADQTQNAPDIAKEDIAGEEGNITVTVEDGSKSVKLTADENGNVKQVETVVSKEQTNQQTKGEQGKDAHTEQGREEMQTENPLLGNVVTNKVLNAEVTFGQTTAYVAPETNQIMNQILDYMKIQLKPGMDQLEMQLHPASLGTVHIQITSKGGEVAAQFHVQNETVKAAIESQLVELKESLREQGIAVEAVEVTVESHAFEQNLWQGKGREEDASYQESKKSPRRIDLSRLEEDFEEEATEEEILTAKMMEANGNTVDYTA